VAGRGLIRRISGGLLQATVLACLAGVVPALAVASPPTVTINSPANGSVGNDRTPSFIGLADPDAGTVTLRIYPGMIAEGAVLQKLSTNLLSPGGAWSLHPTTALIDGVYTAQASQTNAELQTGSSPPVSFRVDTAAPTVTLDPPEPAPGSTAPAFTGTASETRPVSVEIYSGAEETLVSTATAAGTGATWRSSNASPPLAVGQYTAVAFQESSLTGNPEGRSQAVSFSIQPAPPVLTALAPGVGPAALAVKVTEAPHGAALMAPFPVVRIAGGQTRKGVRLRLLRVQQMPAGAQVRVRCTGRGCPVRALRRTTVPGPHGVEPLTFGVFARPLGFGAALQIFISKPGEIGKYTRFTVRRGRLPERVDTCLDPSGTKPLACPTA
jgi:hypothetical protein